MACRGSHPVWSLLSSVRGLASILAQPEAAYTAVEVAILAEGSSRVVRAVNDGGETVGAAQLGRGQRGSF